MAHSGTTLILIMSIAVLAPLLAYGVSRWLPVPLVIFEIVLGVLVGPDVLGWAHSTDVIDVLSELGLAMLIFLAGYEIQFAQVRGDTLKRSVWAWVAALALGLGLGLLLSGGGFEKGSTSAPRSPVPRWARSCRSCGTRGTCRAGSAR